jgi:hypothetical protein
MQKATMPTLWFSWPGDQHFPLDKQAGCYEAMPGPFMVSLIPGMKHGHGAGWNPPDSYAFAKAVVEVGVPWCRSVGSKQTDDTVEVNFESSKPLSDALLISSVDSGVTGSRNWVESVATLTEVGEGQWTASAALPAGTRSWIINVHSEGLTASSGFSEVQIAE